MREHGRRGARARGACRHHRPRPCAGRPVVELVEVPEWLGPGRGDRRSQLLAVGLAERRGVDVDAPFGLSKITMTR